MVEDEAFKRERIPMGSAVRAGALLISVVFLWAVPVSADQPVAGVSVPGKITVSGKTLQLNGIGMRKATFLRIKVYVASLYVDKQAQDIETILNDNEMIVLNMDFVRAVSAKKLRNAWTEGFNKAPAYTVELSEKVDKFNQAMKDVSEGDRISIVFGTKNVDLLMPDGTKTVIAGEKFRKALLQIWLGPNPPNEELKTGLLGKAQ